MKSKQWTLFIVTLNILVVFLFVGCAAKKDKKGAGSDYPIISVNVLNLETLKKYIVEILPEVDLVVGLIDEECELRSNDGLSKFHDCTNVLEFGKSYPIKVIDRRTGLLLASVEASTMYEHEIVILQIPPNRIALEKIIISNDADGDGFSNLVESIAGTNPKNNQSYPEVIINIVSSNNFNDLGYIDVSVSEDLMLGVELVWHTKSHKQVRWGGLPESYSNILWSVDEVANGNIDLGTISPLENSERLIFNSLYNTGDNFSGRSFLEVKAALKINPSQNSIVTLAVNQLPVADIKSIEGADFENASTNIMLGFSGAGSSDFEYGSFFDSEVIYSWYVDSKPENSNSILSDPPGSVNSFLTPDVKGLYVLCLIVGDGQVDSIPVCVDVNVNNFRPVAVASRSQARFTVDMPAYIGGELSRDADDDMLTYTWELKDKPGASILELTEDMRTDISPVFVPDVLGSYLFCLTVNDGLVDSVSNCVAANVNNSRPVANAGGDLVKQTQGIEVVLDGSLSEDVNSDFIEYLWEFEETPDNSIVAFTDQVLRNNIAFTPELIGNYKVCLTVKELNSPGAESDPDCINIDVSNVRPVANAGSDIMTIVNDKVILNGGASSDEDGEISSYQWNIVDYPNEAGDIAPVMFDGSIVLAEIIPKTVGRHLVQLQVFDGSAFSIPDEVILNVISIDTTPAMDDIEVPVTNLITAELSDGLSAIDFTVETPAGDLIAGIIKQIGNVVTFTPDQDLDYKTIYKATIIVGLTDEDRNSFEKEYFWSFTSAIYKHTALQVSSGFNSTCTLLNDGRVKCWGQNDFGELGYGDVVNRGIVGDEMGDTLPYVAIEADRAVLQISNRNSTVCILLADGGVKCWGNNGFGQLGQGDAEHRGDDPLEMGENLSDIDFGNTGTAIKVVAGETSCALFDNGGVRCWGKNVSGQLGQGSSSLTVGLGVSPGDMSALQDIDLGTGRKAIDIAAGNNHVCALLDGGEVKCWGKNDVGQLGLGDTVNRGDDLLEMGDALSVVKLGAGVSAVKIKAAGNSSCVLLDNGDVKCWGDNQHGQLGQGDIANRGDDPLEMGDALVGVKLGANGGAVVSDISMGDFHTCVLFDNGVVKCWGKNNSGQLGFGNTSPNNIGDTPGEMGNNLTFVNLGTDVLVKNISVGTAHTCVSTSEGAVKCWGKNDIGQLGIGGEFTFSTYGNNIGDMGDDTPIISIGSAIVESETTIPAVTAVNILNAANGVYVQIPSIAVSFDKTMDPTSLNGTTFIVNGNGANVAGDITVNGRAAYFAPQSQLDSTIGYTLTVTTGATDTYGNGLAFDFRMTFGTE